MQSSVSWVWFCSKFLPSRFATLCTTLNYIATNTHTCPIASLAHWHLTHFINYTWKCLVVDLQLVLVKAGDCVEGWWRVVELLSCPSFYGMFPSTFCVVCTFLSHLDYWSFSSCLILGPPCIFLVPSLNIFPSSLGQHHVEHDSVAAFLQRLVVDWHPVSMVSTLWKWS